VRGFMPIGYGGGISIEQIKKNIWFRRKSYIEYEVIWFDSKASIYGEQSIVVCIDAKKALLEDIMYMRSGQDKYKISPDDFAKKSCKW
jgi:imidazole glycerol phosphate synthase subunit HisF